MDLKKWAILQKRRKKSQLNLEDTFKLKKIKNKKNYLNDAILSSFEAKQSLLKIENKINLAIQKLYKSINKKGKIFFCGNGGSAADAQHLAAELLVRLRPHLNRKPIAAIPLALDTSTLTACGNDYDFRYIYSRSFEALSSQNDILVVISTSGKSKNIIEVLKYAKRKKIFSIGFYGSKGGEAKKYTNLSLIVESSNVARIQESHIFLGHYILEKLEDKILKFN